MRVLAGLEVLGITALFATVGQRGVDPELLASAFWVTPLRIVGGSDFWYPSSRGAGSAAVGSDRAWRCCSLVLVGGRRAGDRAIRSFTWSE
jgi:hypothetical protein